ncbi:PREDICTED: lipocalin-15-like [Haliaeetus leucocephalus]|uniref:lipocalin-15-like n=1 Tax=Haliaeetus leucocephalus TaxID=52644 RepID=UPI00053CC044|nr:PREDICTED: lipocalin-15-like [Haliaeetus leucocephalus]
MTAVLLSLALALLCLLQAGAEVPVQPGFNIEKFAGMWHVAAAVSNCSVFLKMKDRMKSSIATISFTPEGDLAMKLVWPLLDRCQKFELLFQRSGQAGHYMAALEKRDLRVMETDYSCYAIVHELQQSRQEPSTALQLLTREQNMSPQLLQKFKELIPTVGLTKDMLAILPKSGECQEGTG